MAYEYTVIAAPDRGEKSRSAKTPADRYALALAGELNRMAAEGWDYLRAETLPSEERSGLTGRNTVYHNILVFRRPLPRADTRAETAPPLPAVAPQPAPAAAAAETAPAQPLSGPAAADD